MNNNKLKELEKDYDKYIEMNSYTYSLKKNLKKEEKIKQCAYFLGTSKKIVAITGAGISTNSGIPDFRSNNGIYSSVPEELFSIKHFKKAPHDIQKLFIDLFNGKNYKPNTAHKILKKFEEDKDVTIITQNIDSLHEDAGSSNILNVHGTIATGTCSLCKKQIKLLWKEGLVNEKLLSCDCGGYIRPDIVFYGEDIKELKKSKKAIKNTDVLLIIGTSLNVYPVADLPSLVRKNVPKIVINKDITPLENDSMSIILHDDISEILNKIYLSLY